jgi:hypothetical protein
VGENGIIQASLASLKHCQNLSALTLELRFGITGSVLPLLQYCPRLSTLVLAEMNPYKVDLNIIHKFNQEDLKPLTDADLAILPNYPQLTELTLSGTCAITGIGLQHLRNCKQLSSLNLFDMVERCYIPLNEFPDLSSLAGCPNLKHLQFRVTQSLRDGDILALEACQQIETVDLDRVSFITQAGVDALQAKCPRLKIIFPPRRL